MTHAYIPFFVISVICIIMIAIGVISEALSYKAGNTSESGNTGFIIVCLLVLVIVQIVFGTLKASGKISKAEANYYISLWEHNEYLQKKYLEACPEAKKAYEKEIDRTIRQIKYEQKYMSYEDWDAYCKIIKENTHGNRNESTLPGKSDTESFQK